MWVASRCSGKVRLGRGRDALPEVAAGTASNCLDNYCLDKYSRGAMGPVDVERAVAADGGETIATLVFQAAREMRTALERKLSSHGITAQQATLASLLRPWERKKKPSPVQVPQRLGTDGPGMHLATD